MPRGISSRSSTAPLCGSMRRISLSSPSQVPCHSSPSTQVTPVTKRLDSMVRRIAPVAGSIWWILRSRYWPTHRLPSAQVEARVAAVAGRRDRRQHVAGGGIDLVDARLGDLVEVRAVEGGAGVAGAVQRARGLAAGGIEGDQRGAGGGPDALAVVGDAVHACRRRRRGRTRARSRPRVPRAGVCLWLSCWSSLGSLWRASESAPGRPL